MDLRNLGIRPNKGPNDAHIDRGEMNINRVPGDDTAASLIQGVFQATVI